MSRLRRGWTLHEMAISLSVTAGIVAIAVHAALGQLRFFRGAGEIAATRNQLHQATAIVRAVVWSASAAGGDMLAVQDTAVELRAGMGSAVVCASAPGWVIIPAPSASGNTLAAFEEPPQPDDLMVALLDDSTGSTWLTLRVAAAPVTGAGCPRFAAAGPAWTLSTVESIPVPAGAVVRFLRPLRLSLYRASDSRWYLGARDWNAASQRFNTVQPVAGPLDAASADAGRTGLRFRYLDAAGNDLAEGASPGDIAAIHVVARGSSLRAVRVGGVATGAGERYADSATAHVALRNAR